MTVLLRTFKDHKIYVIIFRLKICNSCVRNIRGLIVRFFVTGRFSTTNPASYEALPVSPLVCILLCSSLPFPMLA